MKEKFERIKCNIVIKIIIVTLIIITNLFVYIPISSFAEKEQLGEATSDEAKKQETDNNNEENKQNKLEEDDDEKEPALVPIAAYSVIAKYINTSLMGNEDDFEDETQNVNDYAQERRWILFINRSKWEKI